MASTPAIAPPVFLVAAPRSGCAAVRQLLDRHPAVTIAPDVDFLVDAITPDGRFLKREAFVRSVEFDNRFRKLGLTVPTGLPFTGIARALLDQLAAAKPGATVTGATIRHHFDRILWLWPDARFIHLVRDGRDVAAARIRHREAGNLWHGVADWVEVETLWDRMSHKLPPDRQFTLKYEMLASEPEYELRRLCEFLRVPFVPAMLQPAAAIDQEPAGRWRKADMREISAAEHSAARWLLQNGYFLSGTVRPPSMLRRAAFDIQNKLILANHRRERLGTGLWLKGGLIAKLGSRKAKARMKRRQYDILSRD
ncbi:sulfotransferase [Sphingomonas histidinilytica]|uniref:Sulfotransferase family protein n=1 Tax=Rhizorhabdus histidinilytica TaxID=439228 RepID=A0A1T5BZ28_9SPHN|nr:sulfotransferase [Rhizorhabdus histidinilytica]MBO9375213.1 sulfotransferase [Rhizorhabdus histidinilytica]SKB52385.1 Sulfotransferase family protein [Rhizorhabdus histidinilytica]